MPLEITRSEERGHQAADGGLLVPYLLLLGILFMSEMGLRGRWRQQHLGLCLGDDGEDVNGSLVTAADQVARYLVEVEAGNRGNIDSTAKFIELETRGAVPDTEKSSFGRGSGDHRAVAVDGQRGNGGVMGGNDHLRGSIVEFNVDFSKLRTGNGYSKSCRMRTDGHNTSSIYRISFFGRGTI